MNSKQTTAFELQIQPIRIFLYTHKWHLSFVHYLIIYLNKSQEKSSVSKGTQWGQE